MKTAILICLFSYFAYSIGSPILIDVAAEEGNSTEFHQFVKRIELSLFHLEKVYREIVHLSHRAKNAEEYNLLVEQTTQRINETDSLIQEIVNEKNKNHTKFSEKWTLAELQIVAQNTKHHFELLKKSLENHKPHNIEVTDLSFEDLKKFIEEKLSEGKKLLGDIQKLVDEFGKKQTDQLKQAAIKKIDELKTKLSSLEQQVDDALKKNQDSSIQKWLLEQAKSVLKGLENQLDSLEKKLKGGTEFDLSILDDGTFEKLKKEIGDKLKEGKEILEQIHDIYKEYKNGKTKELKEKLVQKIEELKPKLQAIEKRIDDELKNNHPGAIKQWLLEHGRDALKKLEKQVNDIETKLKQEN